MRQVVQVYTCGVVLTYVWKGDEPLAVGDCVRVRNPRSVERKTRPYAKGVVTQLDSDYDGYLVVIHSKIAEHETVAPCEARQLDI